MGTKNNPGTYDCYEAAGEDEPLFVLLARDKHAPTLVWLWASLRELDVENAEKIAEARNVCVAMMDWAAEHRKAPSVGLAQAALAGVLELVRTCNARFTEAVAATNQPTGIDAIRLFLSATDFAQQATPVPERARRPNSLVVSSPEFTTLILLDEHGHSAVSVKLEDLAEALVDEKGTALLKWCAERRPKA